VKLHVPAGTVGDAAWVIVTLWPAMTTVPVRWAPWLAEARSVRSAEPFPLERAGAIQSGAESTLHEHESSVAIAVFAAPPAGPIVSEAGDTATAHACCEMDTL
jgi:hypothetical protein